MSNRVAVIGAGTVGTALAARMRAVGVDVRFGVRDPATVPSNVPVSRL